MANKPRSKNESAATAHKTVDRQNKLPGNIGNVRFPQVFANPLNRAKVQQYENADDPSINTFENAPKIPYGRSKQSRY